jgi:hypothetical protein
MPQLKAGSRLKSAVCDAEVMIVKPGSGDVALTCGGMPMSANGSVEKSVSNPDSMGGCQMGKRYVNKDQSLEILCVKAGKGSLAANGETLAIKDAKKLPSSD